MGKGKDSEGNLLRDRSGSPNPEGRVTFQNWERTKARDACRSAEPRGTAGNAGPGSFWASFTPSKDQRAGRRGEHLERGTHHPSWEPAKLYHPSQCQQGQTPLGGPGVSSRDHTGTTESPSRGLLEALSGPGGSLQALLSEGGGQLPGRRRGERSPGRRRGAGGEGRAGRGPHREGRGCR